MIKKLIKDIIKGEGDFNKGEDISQKRRHPQKARVSPIPLLRGRRGAESRGGRWIHNADNNRTLRHSPTTSPYGDSSFPKEENGVTTDF